MRHAVEVERGVNAYLCAGACLSMTGNDQCAPRIVWKGDPQNYSISDEVDIVLEVSCIFADGRVNAESV